MDRITALQETIDRIAEAAGHYGPERQVLSIDPVDLFAAPDPNQHGGYTTLTTGVIQRALVTIANDHRGCAISDCGTCAALRTGLAACLSELRSEQQALREQPDETEPRSLWRRLRRG
ncbi:hypothetical protein AB0F81_36575 [Actinoplanes sp. NPDC024001]|uniref:hypothetical protein n=1 Tax=Actinoplanes sp. NPDC024001 TaxID=3154598 RepID=UPI0033FB23E3